MSARFEALGVTVSDMGRALAFYRLLGLEFPDGAESEGHVEAQLPGGLRFMLDDEETIRSFEPEWQRAVLVPRRLDATAQRLPALDHEGLGHGVGGDEMGHGQRTMLVARWTRPVNAPGRR